MNATATKTLQYIDFTANGCKRYRTLQHMHFTAGRRDRYRTLQRMYFTADGHYSYKTFQIVRDGSYVCLKLAYLQKIVFVFRKISRS